MKRWNWKTICAVAFAFAISGCATQMPSLAGKTSYEQHFENQAEGTVTDGVLAPGERTTYTLNIKAPAGVKLDDITGMSYNWDANANTGGISINKTGQTDTIQQGAVIAQTSARQMDSLDHAVDTLGGIAQLAAPLVGQVNSGKQATEAAKIQGQAAIRSQFLELLKDPAFLSVIQSLMPKPPIAAPPVSVAPAAPVAVAPTPAQPRLNPGVPDSPPKENPLNDGTLPANTNLAPTEP